MKLKDLMEQYGEYTVPQDLIEMLEKPKPKSVWDLEDGDRYFVLYHDGDMTKGKWTGDTGLGACYRDHGNVFLTEEEAEREVERRKVETLLLKYGGRRWFRTNGYNYHTWVNTYNSLVISSSGVGLQGMIYFDTEEQAQNAVKEIGEERIKKALFEVR